MDGLIININALKGKLGELPCGQEMKWGERLLEYKGFDNSHRSISRLPSSSHCPLFSLRHGGVRIISGR